MRIVWRECPCRSMAILGLAAAASLLSACNSKKAIQSAEEGVVTFHNQLDAEQFHQIYTDATPEFQESGSEDELTKFFSAVHRKLGGFKRATQKSFYLNFTTSGTFVTLVYNTEFANGTGTEQFVWKVQDQPKLFNYKIDSRALIVN